MAAEPSIGWAPSDLFAAHSDLHEQTSSSVETSETVIMRDALGNVECEKLGLNTITEYSNSYGYCAGSPDIESALGTLLTTFGAVFSAKLPLQIVVNFASGEWATVDVTGHQHAENLHMAGATDTVNLTTGSGDLIPSSSGFGVPTWPGMTLGSDCAAVAATLTCTMEHVDTQDGAGDHFVGKNMTPKAELSLEFIGTPSVEALTGWTITSTGDSDAIDDPDARQITAHRYFDLT